ncbi:pyruvate ferredoxin oxidoreductase [Candidatus Bipolaricaulota bacterium]|nr:pyruvate ferredoxin oxidoreductase [Candidatus Bipolaricaulota bacterium]MBS3793019.1 pyruvate ferredoxin oxidoreductase [Candidatus Bipolaricaulota bacterium]
MMSKEVFVSGNTAVATGVSLVEPGVIAAYPITPQSPAVEKISEFIADGEMKSEYIEVESEYSAMSACIGAEAVGARAFTATSSQGLALMHEMLHFASGQRLPIVMAVANRTLAPPWGILNDERDTIAQRDTGWLQFYVESAQEALDTIVQAYRLSEQEDILTPTMVCYDGYIISHAYEKVVVPDKDEVQSFIPEYEPDEILNVEDPKTLGYAPSGYNTEYRVKQQLGTETAKGAIGDITEDYADQFGRDYVGMVEEYGPENPDVTLVTLGSVTGTVRDVVDKLNDQGREVGLVKLRTLRPFPYEQLADILKGTGAVGVLEKDISFGYEGAVFSEVRSALQGTNNVPSMNFIAGLGGRDITMENIENVYEKLFTMAETGESEGRIEFVGYRFSDGKGII